MTFPVATLILKGTNITERRYNYNHKTKGKIVRLTSILFSSSEICSLILAFLPFFCQLRMRKCVTVNLICSETSCDFLQYARNFLHVCSRDTKTLLKKRNLYYNGSPQQVNPFQNVLNPSLLIRLSKYLPKVTPKEFEGKRKGKSGKDETSLFGSKFFFGGKK